MAGATRSVVMMVLFASLASADQKRIYIACDDHTDYLWTADEATYRQAFLNMLDYYLDLADQTANNPAEYQSRFACDGSFWLWEYERNKPAADWDRLIGRLRSGHISAPLTALVSCYGGAPAEAVLRGMYYAGRLERRYDLRFRLAVAMENQTLPWGLASLWAGSGAAYSWRGICGCATHVPDAGDREHDIYWYTGPDGQRVLMKWNSLFGNQSMGGYAECWDVYNTVDLVTSNPAFQARYPYPVIGCFGRGWDMLQTLTDEFVTAAQSLTDPDRQLIVSNEEDFFQEFETQYGAVLPAEARTYGNEWDLYCASMAEVSASVKRSVEKLRAAEALAAIVSVYDPNFLTGRETERDLAFMDLGLYWEHDWTGDGPVPREARAAWQRGIAGEIAAYVDALHADAPLHRTSRITLFRDSERIDIQNEITQNFSQVYTYGYGFNLTVPQVRHEEVGAIARAQLTTDGGDYSPRQARYDWLTLGHFADMSGSDGAGATLSNADGYFFRLGNSDVDTLDTLTPQISPLVGGQVDGPGLGIHDQGGDSHFGQRFALRTHTSYDPAAAMRFALEHQNPLVAALVTGATPRLPEDVYSAVTVSEPGVLLWALKPAEEGSRAGMIARLWNLAASPASATVQLAPQPILRAQSTTHLETDEGPLAVTPAGVSLDFAPPQLRTVRLRPDRRGDLNCDGVVDFDDVGPFVLALSDPPAYESAFPTCDPRQADCNDDGGQDFDDIDPFVEILAR